jgi:hypothetical protein
LIRPLGGWISFLIWIEGLGVHFSLQSKVSSAFAGLILKHNSFLVSKSLSVLSFFKLTQFFDRGGCCFA